MCAPDGGYERSHDHALEDREAGVAALEATQADYRTVLAAVNASVPTSATLNCVTQWRDAGSEIALALRSSVVECRVQPLKPITVRSSRR